MLPFGIQKAHKVDVNVYQKIELGYTTGSDGQIVVKTDESSMITGDYNIVNVDFFVEYKVSDPVAYLFSSIQPEEILQRFARGDKARSTQGSGLGLAIAQTYTESLGGSFRIVIDGDQFSAIVELPKN